jgi:3-hydroxyisobutyrate dehydrogenase-like beta-hydroxyacid dehydrogenase
MSQRLGFIGIGAMGGPMARNLLRGGHDLTVFDLDPDRIASLKRDGARAAASAADVCASCDVVMTSLRSSQVFVEVAQESLVPSARSGQLFIDLGTVTPPETRRIAGLLEAKGASLVDAPVSGGPGGAEAGSLYIFVGGREDDVTRAMPLLDILGDPDRVTHCGPSGSGQVVKGVNQLAMGLPQAAFVEAVAFAVLSGVSAEVLPRAVGGESGFRAELQRVAEAVTQGRADDLLVKYPELDYFLAQADAAGFEMPITRALREFCRDAPEQIPDNMGRTRPSFWRELERRHGGS